MSGSQGRGVDPLVRAVGRWPAKVHTKLLIAFVGTSVLLVALGLLGLRVLGQSNDRVGGLGPLQERAIGYAQIQQDARLVRALQAENAAPDFNGVWPEAYPSGWGSRKAIQVDRAIANAAARIGPTTAVDRLGFVPPEDEATMLSSIRQKADRLSALMQEIIVLDGLDPRGERMMRLRPRAEALATDLIQEAVVLGNQTTAKIDDLIAQNAAAYEDRRDLFIGVAIAALVLALVLGFVLSWSLIGPIRGSTPGSLRSCPVTSRVTSTW